jgi:hypothetical protein
MIKFPYVLDYPLFTEVEIKYAEELLSEYNDFYEYNKVQVGECPVGKDFMADADETMSEEEQNKYMIEQQEHNQKAAVAHFEKIFGNKDFAESALVGLKINWYELQQIISEECKNKTPILESTTNEIAKKIKNVASTLLYAERIVSDMEKMLIDVAGLDEAEQKRARVNNEKIELALAFARDGFTLLLERLVTEDLDVPEYHRGKVGFKKMKNLGGYIDICEKMFFIGK